MGNERERNSHGRYNDRIDPTAVLEVFDQRDDHARPLAAGDVVDTLDIARRTAHNKLNALVERGELETRKVGARGRVWWVPIPASASKTRERSENRIETNTVDTTTKNTESRESTDTRREMETSTLPASDRADTAGHSLVTDAVDAVAGGWDNDDRLDARKAAARAVLSHAVDTGDYVGKQTALDEFRDEYPVAGQDATTWWRKNAREVLSEVGDYSRGHGGYRVTIDDLGEYVDRET